MKIKVEKATYEKIRAFRTDYLNSLFEFQELFIELMIGNAHAYTIQTDGKEIGYAILNSDRVLIEFYVMNKYIPDCKEFFKQALQDLSITEIYCKSFDSLLLSNCLLCALPYSIIGVLYRDYVEGILKKDPEILMHRAGHSSVKMLLEQDDSIKELFNTEKQLTDFISDENVFEFYRSNEFIGCGMVLRTMAEWEYCDLGVWVKPSERGKGIGSQIILRLREFAIQRNLKPSCGCAVENIPSQKAIEKSGFVSKHKLINFRV
jgi:GNAT superfamily N-acetyltransferase